MKFSVIIPTYKRHEDLFRCLSCLEPYFKQPPTAFEVEVIVSDDAREQDLKAQLTDKFPWCRFLDGPSRGPAANRNNGAKAASGDWLVFIDDDCVPSEAWIESIHRAIQSSGAKVIEGKTIIPEKRDSPFLHGVENLQGNCFWSCNLAVEKGLFFELHGFDEDFEEAGGEDMEFAWQLKRASAPTCFSPEALVLHPQRRYTFRGFMKRVPLLRWIRLYRLKTGASLPLSAPKLSIVLFVVRQHLINSMRVTYQHLSGRTAEGWRVRYFNLVWIWLMMPYQLPLLAYWELRFRSMIQSGKISTRNFPYD